MNTYYYYGSICTDKTDYLGFILIVNDTIFEPEVLGNHNINTGTTLLLKTIVN